ncbi:hypothetical protein CW745_11085 [Psychromonas sp. psych-6C06]|nr:hypothetical protein CW745_11085 [Psychromonas sp. psych-6C06]
MLLTFNSQGLFAAPENKLSIISIEQLLLSPNLVNNLKQIEKKQSLTLQEIDTTSPTENSSAIPAGEDLILSLYISESKYSSLYIADIFAIKSEQGAKLSLLSLFESLDFPIAVSARSKNIEGWFIKEENTFKLQQPTNETQTLNVLLADNQYSLSKEEYLVIDDDIFVEATSIEQWFDLTFTFSFADQTAHISTQSPLPIQMAIARRNKLNNTGYSNKAVLPWKESTYQPISAPLLDVQLNGSINQDQVYGNYSLLSVQDIAYLSSELYLSGNKFEPLNNARLTFSKEDENKSLLGPLKASRYQFGDVTPVKLANSSTSSENVGFRFSNQNTSLGSDNKTTTISGNIQAGWDAELYRNGLYVDRQLNIQTGRYDFRDVELYFGENQFEIILYGPQGQVQQVSQDYYIDSNVLKAKESIYDFSVTKVDKSLLGISNARKAGVKGWQSAAVFSVGLTNNLSTTAGASYFFNEQGEDLFQYSIGASFTPINQLIISADYQRDNLDNDSITLSGRTLWYGQSFSLNYAKNRFIKRQDNIVNNAQNYTFIMSGEIFSKTPLPLYYQNDWRHSQTDTGSESNSFTNQLSLRNRFGGISNQLTWLETSTLNVEQQSLFGSLELQKHFSRLYTRLTSSYQLSDHREFTLIKGNLSYPLAEKLSATFDLSYTLANDRYRSKLGLNWSLENMILSSTATHDSDDNWSIGLFTSFGFGYEPTTSELFMAKGSIARSGTLVARVFEDDNLNGQFDEGETLLEGVKVKAQQSHRQGYTGKEGTAVLNNLPPGRRTDIVVDTKTIADPFIIPATPGVSITARKGLIEVLDIPLVNAGELEGTVYLNNKQNQEKAGAYLKVNLHDQNDKLVASTETEFDGYYLFTNIVPGKYTLSIAPEELERKNLHDAQIQAFEFSAAGDVIAGADIVAMRYTFVKGYVVDLGEFNSLTMLKVYWQIIQEKYNNTLQQQVFYSKLEDEKMFRLNAAFFKGQSQAIRACEYLQDMQISCTVKAFEFKI